MSLDISISQLNKSFGPSHVLQDIDLDVAPGGFTVLLGPSGCGKSTLLAAIAGLEEIDSGTIRIGGHDVTMLQPDQRGIAMVFQSYALYPTMTVRKNLSFGLKIASVPKPEVETRLQWASDMLQLTALMDRKPSQLSGGQRQRVAIGRALVRQSQVFLFDEPLSNLDAKLRAEMRVEIKELHKRLGSTIVYVTHDQVEAMTLASKIAVMNGGRIEQYAEPETLYEYPQTLFIAGFVGSPAMNFLPATLTRRSDCWAAEVGGVNLPLDAYRFKRPTSETNVILGIRPEDVVLGDPQAPNAVSADFLFAEPMGADTLAWFDLANTRVSMRMPPAAARTLSGRCSLVFDLDKLSLFSKRTSMRL
ncbi:ABC transporter ATP-binding protein [Consotaella aegiceratis]|uniref:ABC transporter ATP-binding protein n=1 Tax=Consotaella aegiceratis TaxID=3097961 RepID=UPI002F3FAA8F